MGQLLGGHSRSAFLTDADEKGESQGAGSSEEQSSAVFTTWSWQPQQQEGSSSWSFAANQDDMGSLSATSSDDGDMDDTMNIPGIEGMTEQEAHEHVYYQYRNAKRNWRRLTGRPVRRLRRSFKRSRGTGTGRGGGFSRQRRGKGFWYTEPVLAFLSSKGKGERRHTKGKGFG